MRVPIRTPVDIGSVIKARRMNLGLGQAALAEKVGASRRWVVQLEKGNPGAGIELILATLECLGMSLFVIDDAAAAREVPGQTGIAIRDIDAIIDEMTKE